MVAEPVDANGATTRFMPRWFLFPPVAPAFDGRFQFGIGSCSASRARRCLALPPENASPPTQTARIGLLLAGDRSFSCTPSMTDPCFAVRLNFGRRADEMGYSNRTIYGQRLAKRLNTFDLMQGLRSEVGKPAVGTGPHGDAFNDQQASATTKTTSNLPQLNTLMPASSTQLARRGRR